MEWSRAPSFFFVRQDGNRNTAAEFLSALNAQLLTILGLEGGVPPDAGAMRGQFSALWTQACAAASRQHPLLLFIDGLDESADERLPMARLIPGRVPARVQVVVSCRNSPSAATLVAMEHPLHEPALTLRLEALSQAEALALLQQAQAAGADDITAARVVEATRGEPLMTRFVCEEVAAVGMAALDELEHNPPRGVAEYFEQQFDQLRINLQLPFTRDSLGILLVARGGITPLELADALGAAAWDVEDALRPLRRFLIGHERLSLMGAEHFRGALERRLGERETNRYRALLLAWCERYEAAGWPLETPAYALSNYAVLLREAGAREKLYRLPGAPWRRRRLAQTGSYAGYVDDLWLAREAAAEPPADLVEVVRALMRVGQLVSGLDDIHPAALAAFVRIGQPERATAYLNLITNPAKGAEACLRVADACRQSPPGPYWTAGGEAATGKSGFWGVVMRLLRDLRKVEPPRLRADLHTRAAELLMAVGEADIARNFAADAWDIGAAIEAPRSRAAAFAGLAGALVEVGWSNHLPELVMRTEAAMADLDAPDQATLRLALSVATARAGLGELTERLLAPVDLARLVEALRPVDWRRDVSLDVVRALMALERHDDAHRLARAPESNLAVAGNLAEIALHLRERGQASADLERETTAAIQEWLAERKMNSTVRESQPEPEFRTGHRSYTTFVVIPESSAHQDRAFRFLAAKGSPAWCLRAVAELPREQRLRGLAVLAEEFARLGHKAEAETMAMESLDLHEDSDVAHVLEELHIGFACRLAELGAPDAAARIGGLLRDRGRRRHVDIALAVHWVSACEPACAAAACQAATAEMPPGKEDLVVVRRAVSTLLDLRDFAGALTLALSVQDANARLLGLSLLAAGCFAAGVETEGVAAYQAALATALSQRDEVSAAETYLEFFTLIGGAMNNPEDFVDYIAKMSAGQAVGDTYGYWMQSQALLGAAERWKSDRLREAAAESMREKLGSAELTAADVWTRMAAYGLGARLLQQAGLKREAAEAAADCLAACREGFTEWYSSG